MCPGALGGRVTSLHCNLNREDRVQEEWAAVGWSGAHRESLLSSSKAWVAGLASALESVVTNCTKLSAQGGFNEVQKEHRFLRVSCTSLPLLHVRTDSSPSFHSAGPCHAPWQGSGHRAFVPGYTVAVLCICIF